MQIIGVNEQQWTETVGQVSRALYGGNLVDNETREKRTSRSVRTLGTLRVADSYGLGARTSASGRHGPWACWHAHRDVFREIFRKYPHARIETALAKYTADNFEDTYRDTGRHNVGSMFQPRHMPELCDCYPVWS